MAGKTGGMAKARCRFRDIGLRAGAWFDPRWLGDFIEKDRARWRTASKRSVCRAAALAKRAFHTEARQCRKRGWSRRAAERHERPVTTLFLLPAINAPVLGSRFPAPAR
ncbi:hypothetical protein WS68_04885 [Burkholderia sp. TSV86]|nr:hypothetical protein WS68_04885 [Burkholderia sp. TSV86]